jgi:hypothetical protein
MCWFFNYEVEDDALFVELRAIEPSLDFCHNKDYNNILFVRVIVWKRLNY